MSAPYEQLLITFYASKIHRLTDRKSEQNVEAELQAMIKEACDCFSLAIDSDPKESRETLRSKLRGFASTASPTRPRFKRGLLYAVSLVE